VSYRSEKLESLVACTFVLAVVLMLISLGIGYCFGHMKAWGLVGLGIGIVYFLLGLWAIATTDPDRIIRTLEKKLVERVHGPKPPDR